MTNGNGKGFAIRTDTQEPDLETSMKVIYQWNYEPEVEELRRLYVKAAESQWVAGRDIRWDQPIDRERFASTPLGGPFPIERTSYWRSLDADTTWELSRRTAAFRLSQFLHGEQGALMVAAQLVNAVPHTDAKFYAATQTRTRRGTSRCSRAHQEAGRVRPIAPRSGASSTPPSRPRLDEEAGRHADRRRGPRALQLQGMRSLTQEPLLKDC